MILRNVKVIQAGIKLQNLVVSFAIPTVNELGL